MPAELAYALITPHSIIKSRTGSIISRLLQAKLDVVGTRMLAPSDAFVDAYMKLFDNDEISEPAKSALMEYCDANLRPHSRFNDSNRCMLLLFEGKNATTHLKDEIVGSFNIGEHSIPRGDTVRGTYGDFVLDGDMVRYAEPAAFVSPSVEATAEHLEVFSRFIDKDGGIIEGAVEKLFKSAKERDNAQTTLVILKPDIFKPGKGLAGNIIDMFAKTKLYIVGAKLLRLSVAKGEEFYGHLRETFRKRMLVALTKDIHKALDDAFPFTVPPESSEAAAEKMIGAKADHEVDKIVEFMTGRNPGALEDGEDPEAPGTVKCLALLYRGEGAIEKIRNRLGKTNPEQAEDGSIRGHFGTNIMHNAAHASDEPANAERERKIVGLWEEEKPCDVKQIIDGYLASL